jgi:hypothetical protein
MNLCKWMVLVLVGLGGAVAARAQLGVYGTFSADRLSSIPCLSTSVACSNLQQPGGKGSVNPAGFWGGVYYDFRNVGLVRLGLDLRGGQGHSNKSAVSSAGGKDATEEYSALLGVRGSVRTKYTWLKPYAQVSAGWTESNAVEPFGTQSSCSGVYNCPRQMDNFVRYEGFVGADIHLASFMDLRLVELGIGNMNLVGSAPLAGATSVGVKSIGTGVVFHLPMPQ